MKQLKPIPQFKNEQEEADFWAAHDTTEYFDINRPVELDLPNLKPTTKSITLRLPVSLLHKIKKIANKKDVPYQSLMKVFLDQKAQEESVPIR